MILLLAVSLMAASSRDSLRYDSFSCFGLLGAGFPAAFLCDYSAGDAPIFHVPESAGHLDKADLPYLAVQGVVVDLCFYTALLLLIWFVLTYGIYIVRSRNRVDET